MGIASASDKARRGSKPRRKAVVKIKRGKHAKPNAAISERSQQADWLAAKRAQERDLKLHRVANQKRRDACRLDLVRFARTYFTEAPSERYPNMKPWIRCEFSDGQIEVLRFLQHAILYGGMMAWAAMRGGGKDTLLRIALIWAAVYGHSPCSVYACYEYRMAASNVQVIKRQVEVNDLLYADFPEVCVPARSVGRATQRGNTQTVGGMSTNIIWSSELLVFPSVTGSQASGCIITPSSINGSIRGLNIDGQRPTFVALTDPQTRESAKSELQRADIMEAIKADFGGLASHDEPLSCVALVTIIKRGDVADQLTDRETHPEWNGRRDRAFIEWPRRMDLWEQYIEIYQAGQRAGDDIYGRKAHQFYLDNRADMDAGAVCWWPDGYIRDEMPDGTRLEVSATQHLMNLYAKWGPEVFHTEFQNDPPHEEALFDELTPALVSSRLSGYPREVVPEGCGYLVEGIDVGARELHYCVGAVRDDFTVYVVDYERVKIDAPEGDLGDPDSPARMALRVKVLEALRYRREVTRETTYRDMDGKNIEIQLHLVDEGWLQEVVRRFVRESGPRWRSTKGFGSKRGQGRFNPPRPGPNALVRRDAPNWYGKREADGYAFYGVNADYWKLRVHEGYMQEPHSPGSVSVFGTSKSAVMDHRRWYAKHICAEKWEPGEGWVEGKNARWNHLLDATALMLCAADMMGARLITGAVQTREVVNFKDPRRKDQRMTTPDGRPFFVMER